MIVLLAVILFPPRELPKLARSVARFYGTIRRTADDFKTAIMEDPDLNEPIDEIKGAYRQTRWEVRRAEEAARRELAKARMDARMAVRAGGEPEDVDPDDLAEEKIRGRVAAGEDFDDEDDDLDPDFDPDRVGHTPLAVATEPEQDDAGGDDPAANQGAA